MRIVCPTCGAVYEGPDHLMAGGKRTRCARCTCEWVAEPAVSLAAETPPPVLPPPVIAPPVIPLPVIPPQVILQPAIPPPLVRPIAPPPLVPKPEPRPATASRKPVAVALALSIVVLAGLLTAGVLRRVQVIEAWPPAGRLYVWLGLK